MANGIFFWQFTFNVPEDDMTTTQLYVLFLPPFNCDLASSLQRSHTVVFQSYHKMCIRSARKRPTPKVQALQ